MPHRPSVSQVIRNAPLLAALLLLLCAAANAWRFGPNAPPRTGQAGWVEVLDEGARIYLHHNFLSEAECDHLKKKAEERLARSGVVDSSTGSTTVSNVRTSSGMFFQRAEDPVIEAVERRIANFSHTPIWHGEGLQVLRYELNQKYDGHYDYFFDTQNTANGGNRWSTCLMFLTDVEEGGETVFTKLPTPTGQPNPAGFSDCAKHHLAVRPRKGDAVLFHSMTYEGKLEERSMHTSCPVIKGTKYSMAKWIHAAHYNMGDKYDAEADAAAQRLAGPATGGAPAREF